MRLKYLICILLLTSAGQYALSQDATVKRSTVIEQFKGKPYYLHFVKQGETLFGISKAYNVSIQEIQTENPEVEKGMKVDQVLRIPYTEISKQGDAIQGKAEIMKPDSVVKPAGKLQFIEHIVSKKETLYGISKQYGVTVDDLIKANPSMTELRSGMIIKVPFLAAEEKSGKEPIKAVNAEKVQIPDNGLLIVKQGQTLYSIGKQYNISEEELLRLNPELKEGLKTGQSIKLKESGVAQQAGADTKADLIKAGIDKPAKQESLPAGCAGNAETGNTYEVALLLPLNLEMADSILRTPVENLPPLRNFKSFDLFQFYLGSLMALDSLESAGCRVNFHVYDADSETDTTKIKRVLRRNEMSRMDLIIAPVFARSYAIVARFGLQHQIPVVNPLSRRGSILEGNNQVYKIYPGEEAIATKLASFISERFPEANIILVRNTLKENAIIASVFADTLKKVNPQANFHEVVYQEEGMNGVNKFLDNARRNVVLLLTGSRTIVPAFVSKLNAYAKTNDIMLFGLPGWEDIEMETEFLLTLNYHQVVPSYVDYDDISIKKFVSEFRERYGAQPLQEREAFLGYDVTFYFVSALTRFGTSFAECLPAYVLPGLQYNFRFRQSSSGSGYENSDARILRYDDFRWVEDRLSTQPGR